jgi:hypothetical protein
MGPPPFTSTLMMEGWVGAGFAAVFDASFTDSGNFEQAVINEINKRRRRFREKSVAIPRFRPIMNTNLAS